MPLIEALLVRREKIAQNTFEIGITTKELYTFFPGQHADCFLSNSSNMIDHHLSRTFSFCSLPNEEEIVFIFRKSDSAFKRSLVTLPLQSRLALSRPTGYFGHAIMDVPTLFIAGGVGVAPFMSLLFSQPLRQSPICLLSVNATRERIPYQTKLLSANKVIPWFIYQTFLIHHEEDELKRYSERFDYILRDAKSFKDFYISGPTGFVDQCKSVLKRIHIKDSQIKIEDFGLCNMNLESQDLIE